jgi:hypothetical protein
MKYSEADDLQQRQVPAYYPDGERQGNRYSSLSSNQESHSLRSESVPVVPVVPAYRPASSTRYSSSVTNQESRVRSDGTPYIPSSSRSYSHQHAENRENRNEEEHSVEHGQGSNAYYVPSTGRYKVQVRPGSSTYIRIPVRAQESASESQIGSRSENSESVTNSRTQSGGGVNSIYYRPTVHNESSSTYRAESRAERVLPGSRQVVYYPVVHTSGSINRQTGEENRSELRNYDSYRIPATTERSQSRYHSESSRTQSQHGSSQRYSPGRTYTTYQPIYGQSRATEIDEDERDLGQTRIPVGHSTVTGATRSHESRTQSGGATYQVPVRTSQHSTSAHRTESTSERTSSHVAPVYIEPVDHQSRSRLASSRQEGHTHYGASYTPTYTNAQRTSGSEHDSRLSTGYREYSGKSIF